MIDLKINSKNVKEGDTFLALGEKGHQYIEDALNNGASKIICEYGKYNNMLKVKDTRKYLIKYLKDNYYDKIKDIKLIGITGTSGKTTTSFLVYQMLNALDEKTAYIGTNGFYIDKFIKTLNNTTPDIYDLYELLLECSLNNVKTVVMEVSSHALSMNRVKTLKFDIACFTNITSEHMDYHKNMKRYFKAKRKLFKMLRNDKIAIINEGKYGNKLLKLNNYNILVKEDDIKDIEFFINKTKFKYKNYKFNINLVGYYNVLNYIDALNIVLNSGYKIEKIKRIKVFPPKGRMEMIKYKTNVIFIDYAHKPDAVEKVLLLSQKIKEGKIYTILGCGGDRDKTKRPVMGNISVIYSDYVIFTSDNPRGEDPYQILADITEDLIPDNYEIIVNRKEAIQKGIELLKDKDILLILGKGHEEYQIIGTNKTHFSDIECVKNCIAKSKNL